MSFELTGTLVKKYDTKDISDKFKKRDFVLEKKEVTNGFEFTDYIKFQLVRDKCSVIDPFNEGDILKVNFNLRGRKWEKNGEITYFTNLEAWKIEKLTSSQSDEAFKNDDSFPGLDDAPASDENQLNQGADSQGIDDDLPF